MNRKATQLIRSNPRIVTVTLFLFIVLAAFLASPTTLVGTAMGSAFSINWGSNWLIWLGVMGIGLAMLAVMATAVYLWRRQKSKPKPQGMYKQLNRRLRWRKWRQKLWPTS